MIQITMQKHHQRNFTNQIELAFISIGFFFFFPASFSDSVAKGREENMKINVKAGKLFTLKYCICREGNKSGSKFDEK